MTAGITMSLDFSHLISHFSLIDGYLLASATQKVNFDHLVNFGPFSQNQLFLYFDEKSDFNK